MKKYKLCTGTLEILNYMKEQRVVSLDIETSPKEEWRHDEYAPLDANKSVITGISLSVKADDGIYIPLRHRRGINANPAEVMKLLKEKLLQNEAKLIVIHNAVFESQFFYAEDIVITAEVYDTIAAAQLTLKSEYEFRSLADSGLKTLVPYLYNTELPSFTDVTGGKFFDELDSEDTDTIRYACADADYALRLFYTFNEWFENNLPKHRTITELESKVAVYTGMMKYNGLGVDIELMLKKQGEAEKMLLGLKNKIAFIIGDVDIGSNAGTQAFKNYLYNELKLPVLKTTAKFKEAADDEAMQLLAAYCKANRPELSELLSIVQEFRKWAKIKSTYIDGYMKFINTATGRIHADLMAMGTETGRFASRRPNIQNCPRKDNDPIGVRSFIKAALGKVFLDFDFSQIELRVGAFFCCDEKMINTYKSGGDIHAETTSVIYGITAAQAADKDDKDYKERRTIAKNCNFGVFFGLFPKGLQRNLQFKAGLNKSIDECEQIIKSLKNGYPGLTRWQKDTVRAAKGLKYTETAFGRRRYLKGINSMDFGVRSYNERCALNTPIQGTAADIIKIAMSRLVQHLSVKPYIKPVLQVHDELLFEVDEDKLCDAAALIKSVMESLPFEDFDLPIVAEGETGQRFGELKPLRDA